MRYITEFEIALDVVGMDKNLDRRIEFMKKQGACNLGNLIADKIGWEERPHEGKRFELEVQCFSRKDWEDLKSDIHDLMPSSYSDALYRLFREAESKGLLKEENKEA